MSISAPFKFRCMIPVSSRKSRGLVATSVQSLRRRGAVLTCSLRDFGDEPDPTKRFLEMASPKEIAGLSEDINRLSASLAGLKNDVQGLAKVNVHKLECAQSPRKLEEGDWSGMDVNEVEKIGNAQKTEEGSKPAIDLGKGARFPGAKVDQSAAAERRSLTIGKSEEEESALGEFLAKIQGRDALASAAGIEDKAGAEGLGKLGAVNVGKTERRDVGKTEMGTATGVDSLDSRPVPGFKLEDNVAKGSTEVDVGKTQVGKVGKIEEDTGKTKSVAKPVTELNVGKTQIGKMGKVEEGIGKTESADSTHMSNIGGRVQGSNLNGDVADLVSETSVGKTQVGKMGKMEENMGKTESAAKPVSEMSVGKTQVRGMGKMEEDGWKTESANVTDASRRVQGSALEEDVPTAVGKVDVGKSQVEKTGTLEPGSDADLVKMDTRVPQSKLKTNVVNLCSSSRAAAPGLVGKSEGRDVLPSPDSFTERVQAGKLEEGGGAKAAESLKGKSKLEENVRKLHESFGDFNHGGLVGKTEGKEFSSASIASRKVEQGKSGNGEAGSGDTQRELKEDMSAAKEPTERSETTGETRKDRQMEAKLGKEENVGQSSSQEVESRASKTVVGNEATTANRNDSGSVNDGKVGGSFFIYLASKDSAEDEHVERLMYGDGLDLPDGAVMVAAADASKMKVRDVFDVDLYFKNLGTSQFGRLLLYSPLLPSTHTLLSQNFHSVPVATLCVAGIQLQGKGRAGNLWHSPEGCLMFSFTVQMTNGRQVPFLQYVVSLAIIEAVLANCDARGVPCPDLRIKWPNDLYTNGKKIGGVLCTSSYRNKTFNIVVGVGLNVGNQEPTTCLNALIESLWGHPFAIQQEELLAAIMLKFANLNGIFQNQGFLPLQEEYCRKWLHSGQSVVLEERDAGRPTATNVSVTIRGLTPTGYLLATDDAGGQYELHPDGNSFDFLNGLVRRKLPA